MSTQPPAAAHPPTTPNFGRFELYREENRLLIKSDGSQSARCLPERCIKCDESAPTHHKFLTLSWHNPIFYVLILAGILPYALAYLIIRRTVTIRVSLCAKHHKRRHLAIILGVSIIAIAFICLIAAIFMNSPTSQGLFGLLLLSFFVLLLTGVIATLFGAQICTAHKLDDQGNAWIDGVGEPFLADLPPHTPPHTPH